MKPLPSASGGARAGFLTLVFSLAVGVAPLSARAQAAGCDQGVVRLPDSSGTVTICSALAAQVPQLARQLADAARLIGAQGAQLRELTRLVKGLNAAGAGLDAARQERMLASLSAELARAQRAGGEQPRRTLEELGEQFDNLRDQLIGNLGQERSAAATRQALRGPVGDAIAQLELRSAARQLDDIQQRLAALQSDVSEVKAGVNTANETLQRIEKAVDPAMAADRCPDLACAIYESASAATVQRLFDKGARLPGNSLVEGDLLKRAALSPQPDRLQVLDLLLRYGAGRQLQLNPMLTDRQLLRPAAQQLAASIVQASRLQESLSGRIGARTGDPGLDSWNSAAGCLWRSAQGVNLLELAALVGDPVLFQHLRQQGASLPTRELRCEVRLSGKAMAGARLRIDAQTGHVAVDAL